MKLLKFLAKSVLFLLALLFITWFGMGVSYLWMFPERRQVLAGLTLAAFLGLAAICLWGIAWLKRRP